MARRMRRRVGYFAARGLLAKSVADAARFIAERGVLAEGAPVLVRFIAQVASRFGVVVTQKLAAQAVPVIGALGGAAVNYAFIDQFQEVTRAHFVVPRLERRYGKDAVRAAYERFCYETKAAAWSGAASLSLCLDGLMRRSSRSWTSAVAARSRQNALVSTDSPGTIVKCPGLSTKRSYRSCKARTFRMLGAA